MKVLSFLKIDMRRTKSQLICMILFAGLSAGFSLSSENIYTGFGYLLFAAILMHGASFTYEKKQETGFDNMLPATTVERVAGRYALGMVYLVIGAVLGSIVSVGLNRTEGISIEFLPQAVIVSMSIGMIVIALQSILFYIVGRGKSQQMMSFIHMLPGLLFYFGISFVLAILEESQKGETLLNNILSKVIAHSNIFFGAMLLIGCLVYFGGIILSAKIIDKKDFS